MFNEELPENLTQILDQLARDLTEWGLEKGLSVPEGILASEVEEESTDAPIDWKTEYKKCWRQLEPIVDDTHNYRRAGNKPIPKLSFLHQQTYLGSKQDRCVEGGHSDFLEHTDRDEDDVPTGSNHRWQARSLPIREQRHQHREAMKRLLKRSRAEGALPPQIKLAIDETWGHPSYEKDLERDEKGELIDPFILGREDGRPARKYASIQIINRELPVFLDSIPVDRGMSKGVIVEALLDGALDILGHLDIDIVVMDRAYDGEAVKTACEERGLSFLNARRRMSNEKDIIQEMQAKGETVRLETEEGSGDAPSRVKLFVPRNKDSVEEESVGSGSSSESDGTEDGSRWLAVSNSVPIQKLNWASILTSRRLRQTMQQRMTAGQSGARWRMRSVSTSGTPRPMIGDYSKNSSMIFGRRRIQREIWLKIRMGQRLTMAVRR